MLEQETQKNEIFSWRLKPTPYVYTISENCISCGTCKDACITGVIYENRTKSIIDHYRCDECDGCYQKCPNNTIRVEF